MPAEEPEKKILPISKPKLPVVEHKLMPGAMGDSLKLEQQVNPEILAEKDQVIQELRETIEMMELKINKLEQLVKLKDSKIQTLANKLSQAGIKSEDNYKK